MPYKNTENEVAQLLIDGLLSPLTQLDISIEGRPIHRFSKLELQQSARHHHHFTLTLSHDFLADLAENHLLTHQQKWLGKRIVFTFSHKQCTEGPSRSFVGVVTQVGLDSQLRRFNQLVLSGYSPTILLDGAPEMQSFGGNEPVSLKAIAEALIQREFEDQYESCVAPAYAGNLGYSCQYNETHYNFLARTAQAYGEQFFYDGMLLHFGKIPIAEKAISLIRGINLSKLRVSIKARPVKERMHGYNSAHNERLTAGETTLEYASEVAKLSYELSKSTFQKPSSRVAPIKASTHQDIEMAQKSACGSAAADVLIVSGQTTCPFLYPGCIIELHLKKLSSKSSKFIVIDIAHTLDAAGNYTGSFQAIDAGSAYLPSPKFEMPTTTQQIATVTDNHDPLGRVRVHFEWQAKHHTTEWIRVLSPDAGSSPQVSKNRGFVAIPEIGDQVLINFIHGHPDRPFVSGSLFHGNISQGGGLGNAIKSFSSNSGHSLEMDDTAGILLKDKTNKNYLDIDGKDTLVLAAAQTIELTNNQARIVLTDDQIIIYADMIEILGPNGTGACSKIVLNGQAICALGKNELKIHSKALNEINSKGKMQILSNALFTSKASVTNLKSQTINTISGEKVNLNGPQKIHAAANITELSPYKRQEKLKGWKTPPAAQENALAKPRYHLPKIAFPDPKEGEKRRILLFVNGYRFRLDLTSTNPIREYPNSNNLITRADIYSYWGKIKYQFMKRLQPNNVFYADGHHSIETSNHRDMVAFTKSILNSDSILLPDDTPDESSRAAKIIRKRNADPNYIKATLNTNSNVEGFHKRRANGQKAGQAFLNMHVGICAEQQKYFGCIENPRVVDIVTHSMGYAYALGMIDVIKKEIPLGRFYILAPENAVAGKIDLNLFEEVWQYGSNLGEPDQDPVHLQDGVAAQTPVQGLKDLGIEKPTEYGRAFIPKGEPKGFVDSHSIENYTWIFKIKSENHAGYVKDRK